MNTSLIIKLDENGMINMDVFFYNVIKNYMKYKLALETYHSVGEYPSLDAFRTELLCNLINAQKEYNEAENEYIFLIKNFLGDCGCVPTIYFDDNNKMFLVLVSILPFNKETILDFCDEFGFAEPHITYMEHPEGVGFLGGVGIYQWSFTKNE